MSGTSRLPGTSADDEQGGDAKLPAGGTERPATRRERGPVPGAPQPAPVGAWSPDHLGPGFQQRTIGLRPDAEDDGAVATLVRHVPAEDPRALPGTPSSPRFAMLYVHGWNDYFFQTVLARDVARTGGAFHALDLRRCGRSLREGQMVGWTTSLSTYDEEIDAALALVRAAYPGLPVVLMGHSLGGLITSLWADRHPGAVDALVLNGPWLEIQGSPLVRVLGSPVLRGLGRRDPRRPLPLPASNPGKVLDVARGWTAADGPVPDPAWKDDPWVAGYPLVDPWRPLAGSPIRPGWLLAVMAGQARVARGLDVRCPVLLMSAARTHLSLTRTEDSRRADPLVDGDACARRAVGMGGLVTVARFDGAVHDVVLSAPPVREQALSALRRWLGAYVLR